MNKVRKAIIPAAGFGTRFLPVTKAQPKEMLPIVDKPAIQYVVEEAVGAGIKDILIIIGRNKNSIENHFDRSPELEAHLAAQGKTKLLGEVRSISEMANIQYIRQKEPKGLGDAIRSASAFVGNEPVLVLLGDDIIKANISVSEQIINVYNKTGSTVVAVQEVEKERISSYGIIQRENTDDDDTFLVKDLVEKPAPEEAPSNLAIVGRYILVPKIFEILETVKPGKDGEIQLTDALRELLFYEKIYAYKFQGKRYDIGDKLEYIKTVIEFALDSSDVGEELKNYLINLGRNLSND